MTDGRSANQYQQVVTAFNLSPHDCAAWCFECNVVWPRLHAVWKAHRKHFLVLTSAGKPVYSRYGDDSEITAMTSVITAVIGRTLATADPVKTIVTGDTTFVFQLRGALCLVAVCRTGEPVVHLIEQLRALHSIILMHLSARVEQRLLERSNLDIRASLVGIQHAFTHVIRIANRTPTLFMDALPVMTLSAAWKGRISGILTSASTKCPGVVYSILIAGYATVAFSQSRNKEYALRSHDALLLTNLVQSSPRFRDSDGWLPVCLPTLNATGFLHALISHVATGATAPGIKPAIMSGGSSGAYTTRPQLTRSSVEAELDKLADVAVEGGGSAVGGEEGDSASPGAGAGAGDGAVVTEAPYLDTGSRPLSPIGPLSSSTSDDASGVHADLTALSPAVSVDSPAGVLSASMPTASTSGRRGSIGTKSDPSAAGASAAAVGSFSEFGGDVSVLEEDEGEGDADPSDALPSIPTYHASAVKAASGEDGSCGGKATPIETHEPYRGEALLPSIFLVLVTSETDPVHLTALTARKNSILTQMRDSGALSAVMKSMDLSGVAGVGDFNASAYGIPGLLHFTYMWKPLRQYTMSRFPPYLDEYVQRKALLRAYQHVFDKLTNTHPSLRHAISSYYGIAIGHVAGIHTTNAILLCAFDTSVTSDKIAGAMEKLAKTLRRDHEKLLLPTPGTLS